MKAFQFTKNGEPISEFEITKPKPSGKEILIKTVACGVCHSDVHIHEGYFQLGEGAKLPVPLMSDALALGHEVMVRLLKLEIKLKISPLAKSTSFIHGLAVENVKIV